MTFTVKYLNVKIATLHVQKHTNTTNKIKQDQTKGLSTLNPAQGALARLQRSLALAGERGGLHFGVHHSHRGGLDVFEARLLEDAGHVGLRTLETRLMLCGYDKGQVRIHSGGGDLKNKKTIRSWRTHVFSDVFRTWSRAMGNMCVCEMGCFD